MDLVALLVITILLCSLILLVQGSEGKTMKYLAVLSIAVEILYILIAKDLVQPSLDIPFDKLIPCVTGVTGLVGLFKSGERSIPLLIFFTSLLQFFVETGIIDSIS